MSTAVRQSGANQASNHKNAYVSDLNYDIIKRLKIKLNSHNIEVNVHPNSKPLRIAKMYPQNIQGEIGLAKGEKESEKVIDRFVERIVEIPVDRVVEKVIEIEKIVKVQEKGGGLIELFEALISSKLQVNKN